MKILFWNCRGLGRPATQQHLTNQIHSHGPDVILLSETFARDKTAQRVARRSGFQASYVQPPEHRRNGFLVLWSHKVSISILFSTDWLLELQLSFQGKTCYMIFIHADSRVEIQERQWELIVYLTRNYTIPWFVLGDFNAMLHSDEKRGGLPINRRQVESFSAFLASCNLCEIPIKGPQFTWSNGQQGTRRISEKIDRVFVHPDFFDLFPSPFLYSQIIIGSDHCPMVLDLLRKPRERNRPFRFEAMWMQEESCTSVIAKFWQSQNPVRPLSSKLQGLSWELRQWNRKSVGNIHDKINKVNEQLLEVQEQLSLHADSDLAAREYALRQEYNKLLAQQELFWFQKSRINWLKWGDQNTDFFHKSTIIRRQKNYIYSLRDANNVELSHKHQLHSHVLNYFTSLFREEPRWTSLELINLLPRALSEVHNSILSQIPSHLEIWNTIKSMPPLKAPGPDGYPAGFYQSYWELVGDDVVSLVQNFFTSAHMPESLNHTFIALIPKVSHPRSLNQYRPISLCNVAYKVISKIISNRLRPMLANIISPNQVAFVPGRNIWENILIHHEVCHKFHKSKKAPRRQKRRINSRRKGCFALKLDFSKAYDRMDWDFVTNVLKAYGFNEHNIKLIMACVSTVTYSVLFNGSPIGCIKAQRGLRQGDPISPYLFILCQQVLSSAINRAEMDHRFKGFQLSDNCPSLTHLMFADDIIIYGHCVEREAHCLLRLLHKYSAESGQEINFQKSSIKFSNSASRQQRICMKHLFNVRGAPSSDKYLGVPVLHKKPTYKDCQGIIEKVSARLDGWKAFLLSQMGRVTLIKSVLNAQGNHLMSCYSLPKSILNKLDALARQFFWKNGKNAASFKSICWNQITLPLRNGGLNIKRPDVMNKALLLKLAWKLQTMQEGLWARYMKCLYFPNSTFLDSKRKQGQSYAWRQLQELKGPLRQGISWVVANGQKINLFFDYWLSSGQLLPQPQLLTSDQLPPRVSHLISPFGNVWNEDILMTLWPSNIVSQVLATPISPSLEEDKQVWKFTSSGSFSVASAYRLLLGNSIPVNRYKMAAADLELLLHMKEDRQRGTTSIHIRWIPPTHGYIKLNFDGAFRGSSGEGAIGVIARDEEGRFMGATATRCDTDKAIIAEAWAALEAIRLAVAKGFKNIILEGDSLIVVKLLNGDLAKNPWQISAILDQVSHLRPFFSSVSVVHIYREGNKIADVLANFALDYFQCTWLSSPPPFLAPLLFDEARGCSEVRSVRFPN